MTKHIRLIGAASGWGAPDQGCAAGPLALQQSGLLTQINPQINISWGEVLTPDTRSNDVLTIVTDMCRRVGTVVRHTCQAGHLPIVIGGDHSCAIGTWSAIHQTMTGPLGLIWVDAHMDSHIPETSPSGAYHGMPLATLMGYCAPKLCEVGGDEQAVQPGHVCLIGVHSFEPDEARLLNRLGVRIITMAEIRQHGLAWAWQEALRIATTGTAGFGITIDLDAVDPRDAPGVGTPEAGGFPGAELVRVLRDVGHDPRLQALEIVEYNPARDRDRLTLKLIATLVRSAFDGDDHHA